MRRIVLYACFGIAACTPAPVPVPPPPYNPPEDVASACVLPEVEADAYLALLTHRLALVRCRSAAMLNDLYGRRTSGGK